jgi:ATP-binding cassette subfamily C protein
VLPAVQSSVPHDASVEYSAQVACSLVAKAMGTEIPPQAASVPAGVTDDPVTRIAQAARVPTRPVSLQGRWWRQNLGPLVGYLGPDRRPVALLRRLGGYAVVDEVATGRWRVT